MVLNPDQYWYENQPCVQMIDSMLFLEMPRQRSLVLFRVFTIRVLFAFSEVIFGYQFSRRYAVSMALTGKRRR